MGFLTKSALSLVLLLSLSGDSTAQNQRIFSVDGSGTTNPSRCYWSIMETLTARAKLPLRLTYRAVGSTTGQAEFSNGFSNVSVADFGSGDLPIPQDSFDGFTNAGIGIVHLPVFLGAVSIFHSVPIKDLNLTGCLLAQIFNRDITSWDDSAILDINEGLKANPSGLDITVVHRVRGSSSTSSTTQYLNKACPDVWTDDLVGSTITWKDETVGCEGSGGVTACIEGTPGSIGYIDAGHGITAGLSEIHLENADGFKISSQQASANGGIAAAETGVLPDSYDTTFADVSLLNRPGTWTWPITLMTYIYVRKDLTSIMDPDEKTLLKAFLQSIYDPNINSVCVDDFGFTLPQESVRTKALETISDLIEPNIEGGTPWVFEEDTLAVEGAGDFVISAKRQSIGDLQLQDLREDSTALTDEVLRLRTIVDSQVTTIADLETRLVTAESSVAQVARDSGIELQNSNAVQGSSLNAFGSGEEQQLKSALILAALSFCMWIVWILVTAAKWISGK